MKSIILLLVITLFPAISFAQTRTARGSFDPRTGKLPPQISRAAVTKSDNATKPLLENHTLGIKGEFQGLISLDVELTGLGPLFSTEILIPSEDKETPATVVTLSATVTSLDSPGSYKIDYSIGARIPMASSSFSRPDGSKTVNFEYRDVLLRGGAKLMEGKALSISKINGKELKITLSKPNE